MSMLGKNMVGVFLFCFCAISAKSTDTLRSNTKIKEVTVFFSGAQITRAVDIKLSTGSYIIALQDIPIDIDPASLQASAPSEATIMSVRHRIQSTAQNNKFAQIQHLEDEIKRQERAIKTLKEEISVYEIEERIMLDNSRLGTRDGVSAVEEIRAAADLYRTRLNEIRKAKMGIEVKLEDAIEALKETFVKLNKYTTERNRSYTEVLISVECKSSFQGKIELSYYAPSAGWDPLYDFRVNDINMPLSLGYNANVYQSTGEDWNDVKLTLSSSNPQLSGDRPELDPWLISYRRQVIEQESVAGYGSLKGKVTDSETGEPLPFVNIVLLQNGQQMSAISTDFDGYYSVKPLGTGYYDLSITYLGYDGIQITSVQINPNKITFQDIELKSGISLAEFEIVEYSVPLLDKDGGSSGNIVNRSDLRAMPGRSRESFAGKVQGVYIQQENRKKRYEEINLEQFDSEDFIANTITTNVANLQYVIDVPFTVRSDGQDYQLKMKEIQVPVEYIYHAIPKLNSEAFLTANLTSWSALNLLSGPASIYFKGTFTGNTFVDVSQTKDTLTLSLGRDKGIVALREGNRELNDKRIIGNNVRETQAWNLSLRNNRTDSVKVILYDQFPISELKSVQVELKSHDEAMVNDKTGALRWEIVLPPASRAERNFLYEVRYPQGNAELLR